MPPSENDTGQLANTAATEEKVSYPEHTWKSIVQLATCGMWVPECLLTVPRSFPCLLGLPSGPCKDKKVLKIEVLMCDIYNSHFPYSNLIPLILHL